MKNIAVLIIIAFCSFLKAQDTIETDRPDQTETPSIVPSGFLQLESGFVYEKVDAEKRNFSHPTVLWRYGVNPNLELRMETELITEESAGQSVTGLSPVVFGFKAKLTDEKKGFPAISFVGHLSAASLASPEFQTEYWAPSFRFLFQHKITEKLDFSYNLGAEWNGETPDADALYTVSASYGFTQKLSGFAEAYGFLNKYSAADHRVDGGLTYLVNNNLLIDCSAGFGLSKASPDYFVSTGISYRIPFK